MTGICYAALEDDPLAPPNAPYDEQFTDDSGRSTANMRYRVVTDGRQVLKGTPKTRDQTRRVVADHAESLKVYVTRD